MSNINLSSIDEGAARKIPLREGALMGIAGVLVLVLILWGGLLLFKKYYLEKNIEQAKLSLAEYQKKMESFESKKVIDFQRRLDVSREVLAKGRNAKSDLVQIEGLIVPGVYLISYAYDDATGKILLSCSGDNFNIAAKQMLSFKGSGLFSQTVAGKTSLEPQTNRIIFPIELKVK